MYELVQAGQNTYYIDASAKIGVYHTAEDRVWLIDSGGDKDAARRICKVLDGQGWTLEGVVNTHSNADHVGGNAALVQRTGCKIVGTGMENTITRYPVLEPSFLYGGYPMKGLRNKFLMAQPSTPDSSVADALLPDGLATFPLPGHFFEMCGVRTKDGVVFLADCLFSEATINKYHVFFVYDVAAFLQTLDAVEKMEAPLFIPAHAEATDNIRPLADLNRRKVLEIAALLLDLCCKPVNFEEVLKMVFDHYSLTLDLNQYVLVGSTVKSYLSYLCDSGQLETLVSDNRLLFRAL